MGLLALAMLGVGCSTTNLSLLRNAPTGLAPDEAIAVVLDQSLESSETKEYSAGLGKKVTRCVQNALQDTHPEVRIVSPDDFREVAFPDLAPEEVPPQPWEELADEPAFRERIAALGVRYLIGALVGGEKTSEVLAAADGDGGVGFAALGWQWRRSSWIEAYVVDLMHGRLAGRVTATASGGSGTGVAIVVAAGGGGGGVLPIPFLYFSFPERRACRELGEGVVEFLTGEESLEQTEAEHVNHALAGESAP